MDSVAKAEEEMKKLLPLSKKIKSDFESNKNKKFLRLYRLQIYDAKKNTISVSERPKEEEEEDEEES